jgi:hypothetical protein
MHTIIVSTAETTWMARVVPDALAPGGDCSALARIARLAYEMPTLTIGSMDLKIIRQKPPIVRRLTHGMIVPKSSGSA